MGLAMISPVKNNIYPQTTLVIGALLFVAFALTTTAVAGAEAAGVPWMEQFRKAYPDLGQLVEMSSAARPELEARMLLTIAASPRIKQRQLKRNLLLEAFETASRVREPLPQALVLRGTFEAFSILGTRAQLQETFYQEELDRLSLQSSAITEMLKIDPNIAKDLFLRLTPPAPKRPACTDVFLQEPSTYYSLLGKIVQTAFSAQEKREARHVELLSAKIREMNSPLDLAPMAAVLRSAPLSVDERNWLNAEFSFALANMELDDRSFSFSLPQTDEEIHGLITASSAMGVATEPLVGAYRTYLARGVSEARCGDAVKDNDFTTNVIGRFNKELARDGDSNLSRFEARDLKPEKVLGEPQIPSFTPSVHQLVEKILDLMFPQNGDDEGDQKSAEAAKVDGILRMFEEIEPAVGEDRDSYLMRKGLAFAGVIESVPAGPEREKLVARFAEFLSSAADNSEDLAVWIGPLRMLLDHIDSDPRSYRVLLDLLRNSPQASVSLFARLEQFERSNAQPTAGAYSSI